MISLKDSTAKLISDVIGILFSGGLNYLSGICNKIFDFLFGKALTGLSMIFDNPVVNAFLYLANTLSWVILVVSFVFFLLKVAREEQKNWLVIALCPFQAIIFVVFNQIIAKLSFIIPDTFVSLLNFTLKGYIPNAGIFEIAGTSAFRILFTLIALAGFTIVVFMRGAAMFIQMMTAPLYVPYVICGDSAKTMEWIVSTVAIGVTFFIQYVVFYAGITMCSYAGSNWLSIIGGYIFMIGTFLVPKSLQKYGWTSGVAHSFQSASGMAVSAMHMLKK